MPLPPESPFIEENKEVLQKIKKKSLKSLEKALPPPPPEEKKSFFSKFKKKEPDEEIPEPPKLPGLDDQFKKEPTKKVKVTKDLKQKKQKIIAKVKKVQKVKKAKKSIKPVEDKVPIIENIKSEAPKMEISEKESDSKPELPIPPDVHSESKKGFFSKIFHKEAKELEEPPAFPTIDFSEIDKPLDDIEHQLEVPATIKNIEAKEPKGPKDSKESKKTLATKEPKKIKISKPKTKPKVVKEKKGKKEKRTKQKKEIVGPEKETVTHVKSKVIAVKLPKEKKVKKLEKVKAKRQYKKEVETHIEKVDNLTKRLKAKESLVKKGIAIQESKAKKISEKARKSSQLVLSNQKVLTKLDSEMKKKKTELKRLDDQVHKKNLQILQLEDRFKEKYEKKEKALEQKVQHDQLKIQKEYQVKFSNVQRKTQIERERFEKIKHEVEHKKVELKKIEAKVKESLKIIEHKDEFFDKEYRKIEALKKDVEREKKRVLEKEEKINKVKELKTNVNEIHANLVKDLGEEAQVKKKLNDLVKKEFSLNRKIMEKEATFRRKEIELNEKEHLLEEKGNTLLELQNELLREKRMREEKEFDKFVHKVSVKPEKEEKPRATKYLSPDELYSMISRALELVEQRQLMEAKSLYRVINDSYMRVKLKGEEKHKMEIAVNNLYNHLNLAVLNQ